MNVFANKHNIVFQLIVVSHMSFCYLNVGLQQDQILYLVYHQLTQWRNRRGQGALLKYFSAGNFGGLRKERQRKMEKKKGKGGRKNVDN